MATIIAAWGVDALGSSCTRTRSPTAKSPTLIAAASLNFCPGSTRLMLAPSGTVTCFSSPASVFTVRLLPLMAVIEPTNRGACAKAIAGTSTASAASAHNLHPRACRSHRFSSSFLFRSFAIGWNPFVIGVDESSAAKGRRAEPSSPGMSHLPKQLAGFNGFRASRH